MSGIYIPNMKMPENCNACPFSIFTICLINTLQEGKYTATHSCPLIEQKHGEWKTVSAECFGGGTMTEYECSLCKERQIIMSNFCPNCGTDMRAEDGE